MNLAAVVVLYQPSIDVVAGVQSYAPQVKTIFAVDNSELLDPTIASALAQIPNLQLIANQGNQGIAHALNRGIALAQECGYEFVLTMDQDSAFHCEDFSLYQNSAQQLFLTHEQAAIVAPDDTPFLGQLPPKASACEFVPARLVVTSGNIVRIAHWHAVAGFSERLFIDEVDHDFCLRLLSAGYSVFKASHLHFIHAMGTQRIVPWLRWHTLVSEHSALRYYYITRNSLFVYTHYAKEFPELCIDRVIKILRYKYLLMLMFERNRIAKLAMILRGAFDFIRGRYGKFVR